MFWKQFECIFDIHNNLGWRTDKQVSILFNFSVRNKSGTNLSTFWSKAWLAWVGNPNQKPKFEVHAAVDTSFSRDNRWSCPKIPFFVDF